MHTLFIPEQKGLNQQQLFHFPGRDNKVWRKVFVYLFPSFTPEPEDFQKTFLPLPFPLQSGLAEEGRIHWEEMEERKHSTCTPHQPLSFPLAQHSHNWIQSANTIMAIRKNKMRGKERKTQTQLNSTHQLSAQEYQNLQFGGEALVKMCTGPKLTI